MSTHWDIYCRDCGVGAGFSVNHGEAQLRELFRNQETWSRLSVRCDLSDIEMRLSGDERCGMSGWPKFANNHSGHDVALRNEYGVFDNECGAPVRCPSCPCYEPCNLPPKHAGEHKVKRRGA